eukprot:TRINITY_DN47895_c0_g1_i1.p1 TRINITY_DN47895_c0_g1~~TRINITY_DN47895_c0_g1_i1.p1  ORF type:complete len:503 (+),score=121.28 TRINITY_DN47895_c0_g1_i1:130-1509(+)
MSVSVGAIVALFAAYLPTLAVGAKTTLRSGSGETPKFSSWHLGPPPPAAPPRFIIMSSPRERKVSWAQVSDDFKAVGGHVKPLVDAGLALPQGIWYDPQRSRLFVADPSLKKILSYYIEVDRCLSQLDKIGVFGTGANADPMATDASSPGSPLACDLEWNLVALEPVIILDNVIASWVTMDAKGHLYYTDQEKKSINRIDAALMSDILRGDIKSSEVKRRSQEEAAAFVAMAEGARQMQIGGAKSNSSSDSDEEEQAIFETSVIEIFQASLSDNVAAPASIASDAVDVYWTNEDDGEKAGTVAAGAASPEATAAGTGAAATGALTKAGNKGYGIAVTYNAILYSDAGAGVYGIPKFAGGHGKPKTLNNGFILSRGLAWDGDGTVFVADGGASMVYAMSCGRLVEGQPLFPVTPMNDVFGVAVIKPTDHAAMEAFKNSAGRKTFSALAFAAVFALAAFSF